MRFLLYPETKRLNETEQPVNMDIRSKEGRSIFSIFVEYIEILIDRRVDLTISWKDKRFLNLSSSANFLHIIELSQRDR